MVNKIQPLCSNVVTKLRSGINLASVAHCVEELVLNSIDAGASCIAVHLNLPIYQIQVIDNGCGMDLEQLRMIGTRYATSKCHSLEDLKNLKSGGFRGEAVSSLKELTSVLMIESRAASSKETYCKIFTQGSSLSPKKSINSRPSKGTTVSVHNFMYNMPVRRNSFSSPLDLEECRKLLQGIALMHPETSFTLKNDATGEMCLQIKKSSSLCHSFFQIFGKSKSTNLKNIEYKDDGYEMSGCVSTDCHVNKDLQFLYVNKRRVLHTKLHKIINNILNKALNSRQRTKQDIYKLTPEGYSPTKTQALFCIYILNISCPYDKYDIIFEPRKTMIEFSEWNKVLNLAENCLVNFLKKENLFVEQNETTVSNCAAGENNNLSNFDTHDCTQGLFSHIAKRIQNNLELCIDETVADNQNAIPVESNHESSEKSSKSLDESNIVCLKSDMSGVSVLDSLKKTNVKLSFLENSTTASAQNECGIPCRSVFPSKSPVMLRVPVTSTLSDLQAGSSNSDFFRKLKEKFQFSLEKRNKVQDCKSEKNACALNHKSKVSFKHNFSHKSHLITHQNKSDPKGHCNSSNLKHKSSQCPSVSSNMQNTIAGQPQNNPTSTQDKCFQCTSISSAQKTRTISRFQFREELPVLSSKHFEKQGMLERNNKKTVIQECIAVAESLLESVSSENEYFKTKKLKLSSESLFLENITDISNEHKNTCDAMDVANCNPTEDFVNNYEAENTGTFAHDTPNILVTESIKTSEVETGEFSNLNHQVTTCFDLQTFNLDENVEQSNSTAHRFNNLDIYPFSQKEDSGRNFSSDNTFMKNVSNSDGASDTIIMYEAEESCSVKHIANSELDDSHLHVKVGMLKKNKFQANDALNDNFILVSSDLNIGKPKANNTNISFDSTHLLVSPDKSTNIDEEIIQNPKSDVSPIIEFQYKPAVLHSAKCKSRSSTPPDLLINKLHSCQTHVSATISEAKLVNFDTESSAESRIPAYSRISFAPISVPLLQHKSQENRSGLTSVSTSISDAKLVQDVNFDSEPFTESLPTVSNSKHLLKENINSDLSSRNVSNSKSGINESQFSELVNVSGEMFTNFGSTKTDILALPQNMLLNYFENETLNKNVMENSVCVESTNDIDCMMLDSKDVSSSCCNNESNNDGTNVITAKDNDKLLNRWKSHAEPETKRVIYIDSVTGNSTYVVPEDPGNLENKLCKELCEDTSIECMLNQWENPMFDIPYEVATIGDKPSHSIPQMYTFLNSYKFSQNTLKSLQVIGQVDCKFIACVLQNFNKNCAGQKLLALFDQHAVHERIRLEELIKDLHEVGEAGEKIVKSTCIFPALKISFDSEEIRLLHFYREKLHQIGIHLEIEDESLICSVNSVPSCLVDKRTNQLRRSREDSLVILQNTIIEWLSSIVKTRCIPQVLPKTLSSVLNSQACRGAVKFGDPLSLEQCFDLLKSLSDCKLPFQCAHGRPSVAPLLDMNKIQALYKKRSQPHLSRLSVHSPKQL